MHVDLVLTFATRNGETLTGSASSGIGCYGKTLSSGKAGEWAAISAVVQGKQHQRARHWPVIFIIYFHDGLARGTRADVIQRTFAVDEGDEELVGLPVGLARRRCRIALKTLRPPRGGPAKNRKAKGCYLDKWVDMDG